MEEIRGNCGEVSSLKFVMFFVHEDRKPESM